MTWGIEYYNETLGRMVSLEKASAYQVMDVVLVGNSNNYASNDGWSWSKDYASLMPAGSELIAVANDYTVLSLYPEADMADAQQLDISVSGSRVSISFDDAENMYENRLLGQYVYVLAKMPAQSGGWGIKTESDFSLINVNSQGLFLSAVHHGVVNIPSGSSVALGFNGAWTNGICYGWTSNGNAVMNQRFWDSLDHNQSQPVYIDNHTGSDINSVQYYFCEFKAIVPTKPAWGVKIVNDKGETTMTTNMVPFQFDVSVNAPHWDADSGSSGKVAIGKTMMVPITISGFRHSGDEKDRPTYLSYSNVDGNMVHVMTSQHENGGNVDMSSGGNVIHCTDYKNYF